MWRSLVQMPVGFGRFFFCNFNGYPLANFQLLIISGLSCRCDNMLVSFSVKIADNSVSFACI